MRNAIVHIRISNYVLSLISIELYRKNATSFQATRNMKTIKFEYKRQFY